MKRQITNLLLALAMLIPVTTMAQDKVKIGHVNSNDLLLLMPERKTAEQQLQEYAQSLEGQLSNMTGEYEKKLTDYQTNSKIMADPVRESREEELTDMERRIRDFQTKAQKSITQKEQELMEPMIEKANTAIEKVAKENGYTYVFDTSTGAVLYFPESDDLLPLVKKELGLE